jgi:20S proteasome subunit beta 2
VDYIRPFEVANERGVKQNDYSYKRGTTAVTSVSVEVIATTVAQPAGEAMEVDGNA